MNKNRNRIFMYARSQALTVTPHRSAFENGSTVSFRNGMFTWCKRRTKSIEVRILVKNTAIFFSVFVPRTNR